MNRLQIFPVVLLLIAGLVATASAERQVTTSASEVAVVDFTSQMSAGGQSNPATSYSSQNPVFLPCVHSPSQGYRGGGDGQQAGREPIQMLPVG